MQDKDKLRNSTGKKKLLHLMLPYMQVFSWLD